MKVFILHKYQVKLLIGTEINTIYLYDNLFEFYLFFKLFSVISSDLLC